jgi:hypothetical protein
MQSETQGGAAGEEMRSGHGKEGGEDGVGRTTHVDDERKEEQEEENRVEQVMMALMLVVVNGERNIACGLSGPDCILRIRSERYG